jgi:hypothetical protein
MKSGIKDIIESEKVYNLNIMFIIYKQLQHTTLLYYTVLQIILQLLHSLPKGGY